MQDRFRGMRKIGGSGEGDSQTKPWISFRRRLQRVLIAWAIVDDPNVLLFDEPTSGVDIGAEEPIYDKVNSLKKEVGITILLITHNIHVVMHYADYVLALNKRVLFFGDSKSLTHSQLLSIIYGNEFALSEEEYHKE